MPEKNRVHTLSSNELEQLVVELQNKVTKNIVVQQELISIKDELDQELNRFRLIQEFNKACLFQESVEVFGTIACEYFIQAFEQARCLLAEYDPEQKGLRIIGRFGFEPQYIPNQLPLDAHDFPTQEALILSEHPCLQQKCVDFPFVDAFVAPFFNPDARFTGLVICGQSQEDARFFAPLQAKDCHSFNVMAATAGYLLHNLRTNEHLKNEISERIKMEKQLEAQTKALLDSNEELEKFAYVVSHDLKAPLLNVKGFVQELKKKSYDESTAEYLEIIDRETNRFGIIIDDLLKFARVSHADTANVSLDFNLVVERVIQHISSIIQQHHAIIEVSALPSLRANNRQMEQLFQNLILNAIKFTQKEIKPHIVIQAAYLDKAYCFSVQDNGIGIESANYHRIFNFFQRLHSSQAYEGSGLGLSICKRIVEHHGGKIWVESEGLGRGSTFFFTLPG
ncbi:MAG TPA: ATP-binding protein [Saprospiraceae bacterium]|nr:ATP-binding protein [Saprospiraceae bacterium]HMQ82845.1 ATP-binding protein [Saprospiraceae bacterium]